MPIIHMSSIEAFYVWLKDKEKVLEAKCQERYGWGNFPFWDGKLNNHRAVIEEYESRFQWLNKRDDGHQ